MRRVKTCSWVCGNEWDGARLYPPHPFVRVTHPLTPSDKVIGEVLVRDCIRCLPSCVRVRARECAQACVLFRPFSWRNFRCPHARAPPERTKDGDARTVDCEHRHRKAVESRTPPSMDSPPYAAPTPADTPLCGHPSLSHSCLYVGASVWSPLSNTPLCSHPSPSPIRLCDVTPLATRQPPHPPTCARCGQ